MEFEMPKSKVYIQTDTKGRIIRCEGGYTTPSDLTDWTYSGLDGVHRCLTARNQVGFHKMKSLFCRTVHRFRLPCVLR